MIPRQTYKKLTKRFQPKSGRGRGGRITIRHRGGTADRKLRFIGSLQDKIGQTAEVMAIEYDPNRTARIALVRYPDNSFGYILAPQNLPVGSQILAQEKTEITIGNRLKLRHIPTGQQIHDIALEPGKRGQLVRSAGSWATILAHDGQWTHLKMPSGEVRIVRADSFASIGQVSNPEHNRRKIGKAGRKRHMGWRPTVRGKAMHPAAHPHGGGEGVNPIGLKQSKTPWGKPARGKRTRRRKSTSKFIIKRRK